MFTRACALDAEHPDQRFAILLLAGAAEVAGSVLQIGWQVGDASLDHWIDEAFWREEGESERGIVPNGSVEARVPRGEDRARAHGSAQIVRSVVPIKDCAVGMPDTCRRVADGVGQ